MERGVDTNPVSFRRNCVAKNFLSALDALSPFP
jgi:hypothetical protein